MLGWAWVRWCVSTVGIDCVYTGSSTPTRGWPSGWVWAEEGVAHRVSLSTPLTLHSTLGMLAQVSIPTSHYFAGRLLVTRKCCLIFENTLCLLIVFCSSTYLRGKYTVHLQGDLVALWASHWTCVWEVLGSNPREDLAPNIPKSCPDRSPVCKCQ